MASKDLNRLKVVLAEKKISNKWLAEKMGLNQGTISKWCTNTSQPDLENLIRVSKLLKVNPVDLLRMDAVTVQEDDTKES